MPTRSKSPSTGSHPKGNPTSKKNVTNVNDVPSEFSIEKYDELESRYTDNVDEPTIDTRLGSHPNRNTNKPHIDKPRYS